MPKDFDQARLTAQAVRPLIQEMVDRSIAARSARKSITQAQLLALYGLVADIEAEAKRAHIRMQRDSYTGYPVTEQLVEYCSKIREQAAQLVLS